MLTDCVFCYLDDEADANNLDGPSNDDVERERDRTQRQTGNIFDSENQRENNAPGFLLLLLRIFFDLVQYC